MPNITIKEKQLVIGKEKVDLLSGEVHYWRLNPDFWEDVVDTVRECGLNVIASYVPWQFHRTEDGKLDFTGETSPFRDLVRFIKLLKKKKMWLIIRPGPYLYTEWVNKGVPDEMVQYHRNHPEFKKRSEVYIKEVCRIISPFLASKGGNIIMVQADNEIDMWAHLYEKDLGFLDEPGMFQDFIKKKYKNITVLNKEWGTSLKDLSDAKPIAYDIIKDKYFKKRYRDFSEFKHFYASEFARWVVGKYKEEGIDVPIYLNTYPWFESHDWREFQRIADVVGTDFYPVNEFGGSNNKHRIFMDYIRY
ncbi:MAG: beta-galactosidase, partial [Spirochaetes bacterium]|nr:beta-galactosidase [Spirochaetota bacterium]